MTARDLHALLAHAADPRPDAELLHDPAGFPELVRRHGPLVWATCRRLSPEPADAFQAVFLALSRSAKRIRTPAAVGGWLHAASVRVCLQQRRTVARRRLREKRAARPEADLPVADSTWDRILAAAHEEIDRLPAHERTAFVLCELQDVPAGEAAKQLGWKPGTLTGRLSKARARLLAKLSARGLAPVVGLTAAGAVPAEVLALGVKCVGPAATVPAGVLALSTEVTAMVASKHLAAAVLVTAGLLAGVGGIAVRAAGDPPAKKPEPTAPKAEKPKPQFFPPDPEPVTYTLHRRERELARPQWEHETVDKPGSRQEFDLLLAARGNDGWEFAGVVGWSPPPPVLAGPVRLPAEVLVFKRPAARPAVAAPLPADPTSPASVRRLQHVKSADVQHALSARADLSRLTVTTYPSGNQIGLSGPPEQVARAAELIARIDFPPGPPLPQPTPATGTVGNTPDPETIWGFLSKGEKSIDLNDPAHARVRDRMVRDGTPLPANGILTKERFVADFLISLANRSTLLPPPTKPLQLRTEIYKLRNASADAVVAPVRQLVPAVTAEPDPVSNCVRLTGPDAAVEAATQMLRVLDLSKPTAAKPTPATVGGFTAIPLRHAKAADVARTVRELLGNQQGVADHAQIKVSSDDQRNLVLYRIPHTRPTDDEVRKLVAELDVPAK